MIYVVPTDTCFGIGCEVGDIDSYKKIYKMKGREQGKPFAVVLKDLGELIKHAEITDGQLDLIKNYKYPFTVLLNTKANFLSDDIPNKSFYKKVAFRIAPNNVLKNLVEDVGPIFLTSANLSGKKELYSLIEVKKEFKDFESEIKTFEDIKIINYVKPSNVFEFCGDTTELKYLRKNY